MQLVTEPGSAASKHIKVKRVKLLEGLELVSPFAAAYLPLSQALIVSDTHFGIETELASRGVFVPDSVFRDTLDAVLLPAKATKCRYLYVLGDLKHKSGRPGESIWWALRRLVGELAKIEAELIVIRGNHDKYLSTLLRALGVACVDRALVDGFLLTHGHKRIAFKGDTKAIIIGHEHPAIAFRNEFGGTSERFKCFLLVPGIRSKGQPPVLVLPSTNPLTYGTDICKTKGIDFLSPYLRERASMLSKAKPYALEVGELLLPFPELGKLRH